MGGAWGHVLSYIGLAALGMTLLYVLIFYKAK